MSRFKKGKAYHLVKKSPACQETQKEQILSLRQWANVRAVAATKKEDLSQYKDTAAAEDINNIEKSRGGRALDF